MFLINMIPLYKMLFISAQMAEFTMPADFRGQNNRCKMMNVDAVINDWLDCLENTNVKQIKRLERIRFGIKFFGK